MALLVLSLTLLAMIAATMAYEVKPLDMAPDSFDDQYKGCGSAMKAELPALNHSEFQNNCLFAKIWSLAVEFWRSQGSPVYPLSSQDHAIAITAYNMINLFEPFNDEVRVAGRSRKEYRDNFHFKTLHFLLTDALATLGIGQEQKCRCVSRVLDNNTFLTKPGDIVRLGRFMLSSPCKDATYSFRSRIKIYTVFQVQTCHGVDIQEFSRDTDGEKVLIPPFEKFRVTKVVKDWQKVEIHLDSFGTYSKYNCEWLKGGSVPRALFHLEGLLLATTALAAATGIL
ncbi:erythroblast NAD(P)(+)--arginine ADP-ribosyltransferase-like protein [Turdus rufiventris]|nr:erythroblast NAD(P)(+)--arginine ADP-ribosyltransferase-like protein [Turdus rufiventris]